MDHNQLFNITMCKLKQIPYALCAKQPAKGCLLLGTRVSMINANKLPFSGTYNNGQRNAEHNQINKILNMSSPP